MKRSITSKLKMYSAVLEVCKVHEANWVQVPGFVSAMNEFEEVLTALKRSSSDQESKLKGVSKLKNSTLDELFDRLLLVHSALAIHAKSTGNSDLLNRNLYSHSDLKRLNITRIDLHFDKVIEDLEAYGSELTDYGISSEILEQTFSMIKEGRVQNTRPRMAIIERKQLTNALNKKVVVLDEILKFRLDKLMRLFKRSVPDFYELYFNARVIINLNSKTSDSEFTHEPDDGN